MMKKERQAGFLVLKGWGFGPPGPEDLTAGTAEELFVPYEEMLRLWDALGYLQPQDRALLLKRYGFIGNGPKSLGQLARARGQDKETIRRKLIRIEAEIKKQLLKR